MTTAQLETATAHDASGHLVPDGPLREALRLAVRVLDLVERRRRPVEMSQALGQVGRCYQALGDWSSADTYLRQALHWAEPLGAVDRRVELLCDLAEVNCAAAEQANDAAGDDHAGHEEYEQAADLSFQAARLAALAADPRWEVNVLVRAADVLDRCGETDDAIHLQTRALTLISQQGSQIDGLGLDDAAVNRLPTPKGVM